MAIVIDKPIILTESQTKKFLHLSINKFGDKLSAKVTFGVYCSSGNFIREEVLKYEDEAYNEFWENFNNGTFLYEQLVASEEEEIELPEDLEEEFLNPTDEE